MFTMFTSSGGVQSVRWRSLESVVCWSVEGGGSVECVIRSVRETYHTSCGGTSTIHKSTPMISLITDYLHYILNKKW